MIEKRYQIFGRNGKEWSGWFKTTETPCRWQLKGKLLNEYREVREDGTITPIKPQQETA